MKSVVICGNCGAKVRAGRDRCPRCREKFAFQAAPRFDVSGFAPYALALLAAATVVAVYAVVRQSGTTAPPAQVRTDPPRAAQPAAASRMAAAPRLAFEGIPFIDPNRAGGVAYAGGDYQRALALYQDAVQRNPQDAESWSNLGQVLVKLKRVDEALPHFNRAIALSGQRWAYHFNLARAQGLLGRWDEAVAGYRRAQSLFPDDYATAFNLGLALKRSGDDGAALQQFEKAASLDPQEPTFQLSIAMSSEKLGRKEDAVAAYRKTLALAPEAPEAPLIRTRIEALLK